MNHRRRLILLVSAALAAPALMAPAADAAVCYQSLPSPGSDDWKIQEDGSQDIVLDHLGGSNFDAGHGRLTVNGVDYPAIPNAENACSVSGNTVTYPERPIGGGIWLTRRVSSIDGRIRRLDTIRNSSAASLYVDIDLALRVQGSQVSWLSESGDATVTTADHWSAHENDGGSFPFLQWGEDGATLEPRVVSLGDAPGAWQHKAGNMPDATLTYEDYVVPSNSSVNLLHMSGTTDMASSSEMAAQDRLTPFKGLTLAQAAAVINWGDDPDADGVDKSIDKCPGSKGNQPNGCFSLLAKPVDKTPGDTQPGDTPPGDNPPADTPDTPPAAPPVVPAADTSGPAITITKLARSVRRRALTAKGLAPRIACDEACSVQVAVLTHKRGRSKATTIRTTKATPRSTAPRTVRLKLRPRQLRRLAKQRVTVVVTATDASGNRRSVTRVVRLGR